LSIRYPLKVGSYNSKASTHRSRQAREKTVEPINKTADSILVDITNATKSAEGYYIKPYALVKRFISHAEQNFDTDTLHKIITCLINVNSSTDGSVSRALKHLCELEAEGLSLSVDDCLALLKVLSVHPDFAARLQILDYMNSSWASLTDEAQHYVVAGMFRELQLEKAMEGLEAMSAKGHTVQVWLFDMAAAVLASVGEADQVFQVLEMKESRFGFNTSPGFGIWLLSWAVGLHHVRLSLPNEILLILVDWIGKVFVPKEYP
jgi:hypothetical protein